MAATILHLTTGVVYVRGFSGTLSGSSLTLSGVLSLADGTKESPSLTNTGDTNNGIFFPFADYLGYTSGGTHYANSHANGWEVGVNQYFAWADVVAGAAPTLILARDAANTLAQRNGTNAQVTRVYKTYTDASNYERLALDAGHAGGPRLTFENAGTGSARDLTILNTSAANLYLGTSNGAQWAINSSGHILTSSDNTYDIGASGTTRPRNVYVANDITSGNLINTVGLSATAYVSAGAASYVGWGSRNFMKSPADGTLSITNNAETGFSSLLLGPSAGATSSNRLQKKVTDIADNTATTVFTVTVPNANHAASIKLRFLSSNGSTDAFESSRTAEGTVVLARTTGVDTVAASVAISDAAIATVGGGATHTLAYSVTAMTGAAGATQTFNIQVTIDDSGNLGSNQVVAIAELLNAEATGITIA